MNYFKTYGKSLVDAGFNITPILPYTSEKKGAGKRPLLKDWESGVATPELVAKWGNRFPEHGIGVLTRHTPAVDIDVYDEEAAAHMAKYVTDKFGDVPCRVGSAPKRLYVFYSDTPFHKVKSGVWEDDFGQRHAVEILGDGQQFVAFGIHPGTKREYRWVSGEDVATFDDIALDLESLTLDDARAIAAEFDALAKSLGWEMVKRPMNGIEAAEAGEADDDDWAQYAGLKKWDGSYEDLRAIVMRYPGYDDYDEWVRVMAALQISCYDEDEAKDIAREWSEQSGKFDEDAFEEKWANGFKHNGSSLFTIGSIIKKVRDLEEEEAKEKITDFVEGFKDAATLDQWNAWAKDFRRLRVFNHERAFITDTARKEYKRITGARMTDKNARLALGFDHASADMPAWLRSYVYSANNDVFIDTRTGASLTKGAFDSTNGRYMGDHDDSMPPNKYATDVQKIPVVFDRMYYPAMHGAMPGSNWHEDEDIPGPAFFKDDSGNVWFNTFRPESIPEPAEKLTKYDKKAISVIKDLMVVMFPREKERTYVMDWMSWIIQNPTKRVNYALLVRGAQGTGKSTLGALMTAMLGSSNTYTVSNGVLNGRFSSWAEGHILKIIEEVFDKSDRYSIIEKQKEYITNEVFEVEGKNEKPRMVVNTSSKIMFTNHMDALPLDDNQRRYLVVSTGAESYEDMDRVYGNAEERNAFFSSVYSAIENHPRAIKRFFMEWKISPEFDHKGHAPRDTVAFKEMVKYAADDTGELIAQVIKSGDFVGVTPEIVITTFLKEALLENGADEFPKGKRLLHIMNSLSFAAAGVMKYEGKAHRVYVRKNIRAARDADGVLSTKWAQETLKRHEKALEERGKLPSDPFDDE